MLRSALPPALVALLVVVVVPARGEAQTPEEGDDGGFGGGLSGLKTEPVEPPPLTSGEEGEGAGEEDEEEEEEGDDGVEILRDGPEPPRARPGDEGFDWSRALIIRVDLGVSRDAPLDEFNVNFRATAFEFLMPLAGEAYEDAHLLHWSATLIRADAFNIGETGEHGTGGFLRGGVRYDGPLFGAEVGFWVLGGRQEALTLLTPTVALRVGDPRWGTISAHAEPFGLYAGATAELVERSLTDNLDLELNARLVLGPAVHLRARARYRDMYGGPGGPRLIDETYSFGAEICTPADGLRIIPVFFGVGLRRVVADTETRIVPYNAPAEWAETSVFLFTMESLFGVLGPYNAW